eukprot:TRINITY_DN107247_c0_g1_i1.p2 TRINITY_DN107247_c0_g1~~TRINITY_DN107247_c0_g1_i1.p2  ORF type:complete len:113 (+),score=16.48 TRINITY_DN107247_c0_g1_i1:365-703(+)
MGFLLFKNCEVHVDDDEQGPVHCPLAHLTPNIFAKLQMPTPYSDMTNVFVVKRNPYSRAVSEYGWVLGRYLHGVVEPPKGELCPGCGEFKECSREGLNFFLQELLQGINSKA